MKIFYRIGQLSILWLAFTAGIQQAQAQAEIMNPVGPYWKTKGNSGTNSGTNFIGTTDNVSWRIRTNNTERAVVDSMGLIGIKIGSPQTYLDINGDYAYRVSNTILNTVFDNNNFNLITNKYSSYRITNSYGDDFRYSGFTGGTNGRIVTLYNASVEKIDLLNESALSLAPNRIITGQGGAVTLGPEGSATMQYNTFDNRWVIIALMDDDPGGNDWHQTGNSGTVDGTNFIGTTDNRPLNFRVFNQKSGRITSAGETFFGYQAGITNTGASNTGIGYQAMFNTTTAVENVAVGYNALRGIAANTAAANSVLGFNAMLQATTAAQNVAIGHYALTQTSIGRLNVGVGAGSMDQNTTGGSNVAVGFWSLRWNNTGSSNVAVGDKSLYLNKAGFNTAVGDSSLYYINAAGAAQNTALGYNAGNGGNTTGLYNTYLGANTNSADGLTKAAAIGYNARVTTSNSVVIGGTGADAVKVGVGMTNPNYLVDVIGDAGRAGSFVNTNAVSGFVGLYGSTNNTANVGQGGLFMGGYNGATGRADMVGVGDRIGLIGYGFYGAISNYGVYGYGYGGTTAYGVYGYASGATTNWAGFFSGDVYGTSYTASDRKLKNDIQPLSNSMALINRLKPTTYHFKTDEYKYMNLPEGLQYGLIADEVKEVLPSAVKKAVNPAVYENGDEKSGKLLFDAVEFNALNYTEMIPILIGGMQEQQKQIEELKKQNDLLLKAINNLKKPE